MATDLITKLEEAGEGSRASFDVWIDELTVDVIEGDYGYEPGEFSVFPELWHPMWRDGLSPSQAFKRALDASAAAVREREEARQANWSRIQSEDAAILRASEQERGG